MSIFWEDNHYTTSASSFCQYIEQITANKEKPFPLYLGSDIRFIQIFNDS